MVGIQLVGELWLVPSVLIRPLIFMPAAAWFQTQHLMLEAIRLLPVVVQQILVTSSHIIVGL